MSLSDSESPAYNYAEEVVFTPLIEWAVKLWAFWSEPGAPNPGTLAAALAEPNLMLDVRHTLMRQELHRMAKKTQLKRKRKRAASVEESSSEDSSGSDAGSDCEPPPTKKKKGKAAGKQAAGNPGGGNRGGGKNKKKRGGGNRGGGNRSPYTPVPLLSLSFSHAGQRAATPQPGPTPSSGYFLTPCTVSHRAAARRSALCLAKDL